MMAAKDELLIVYAHTEESEMTIDSGALKTVTGNNGDWPGGLIKKIIPCSSELAKPIDRLPVDPALSLKEWKRRHYDCRSKKQKYLPGAKRMVGVIGWIPRCFLEKVVACFCLARRYYKE